MKIFDSTFGATEKTLDMSNKRHAILSANIANEETPNYIARDYSFSSEIEKAMGIEDKALLKTNESHLDMNGSSRDHVYLDKSMPVGADGNNVDLDIEMGKLSANSRDYKNALNLLTVKLRMLRAAISGGKGGF